MALSNSLCYHENRIKCEIFRDVISYMQMVCLRLSVPEKLQDLSEGMSLCLPFGKDNNITASISLRISESFLNAEKLPHRRYARIKRKDGNIRLICYIPVYGRDPGHFVWKTHLFDIDLQINGNTALIPIIENGHKCL